MDGLFSVQAVMGLVDNITGPLRNIGRGLDSTDTKVESLGSRMGKLTKMMAPLAIGAGLLVAGLSPAISTAADFQASISGVGAVSRASVADMALLERSALDLGASTAWSASEVASAEKSLAMAGYDVQENIAALPGILSLASAAQEDLGMTADVASNILSAFRLEADQTGQVADILTAAFTSSNTTLAGLSATMANAAPVAAAAGASLADVAAMAGKLGDQGINAAVAGTSIKIMFQRLQAPVGAASKMLGNMGIVTKDAAGNMLPIFDILQQIEGATAELGSADKAAALQSIFGAEAVGSVTALMATGVDVVRQYSSVLDASTGAAAEVAARQLDNYNGALTIMGSGWEALKISIGKNFLPILTPLIQGVSVVFGWFVALANNPLGKALIVLSGIIAVTVIGFTAWTATVWAVSAAMPFVTASLLPLKTALISTGTATWGFIAGQYQALTASIAAAGGFRAWAGQINRGAIPAMWGWVRTTASALIPSIISAATATWGFAAATIAATWPIIAVVAGIAALVAGFVWLYRNIEFVTVAVDAVMYAIGWGLGFMIKAGKGFITAIADPWLFIQAIWWGAGEVFGFVVDWIASKADAVVGAITWAFMNLTPVGWLIQGFSAVQNFLSSINLFDAGRKILGSLVNGIKSMLSAPADLIRSGFDLVRNLLPFSDAKEGPLSSLTLSGARIMETMGVGIQSAAPNLHKTVAASLAGITLATASPALAIETPPVADVQAQAEWMAATPTSPVLPDIAASAAWQAQPLVTPQVADLQAQAEWMAATPTSPVLPDISASAAWQAQPLVAPELPNLLAQAQWQAAPLDTPTLQQPAPPKQPEQLKSAEQTQTKGLTARSAGKNVHIHIGNITLPAVANADDLVKQLQAFVESYDG
ncbi:MAG: phage tail tape measure protein [Desulfobacteraceae bacterium 4572_35.1]|nr:MAG: phage tail tape measure protein [Desulfobacteraceae bacterium 4572_35.1]